MTTDDARLERLKLALRENLKRRRQQARVRSDATTPGSEDSNIPPEGTSSQDQPGDGGS
ncbi:MAG: hypothetical protein FWD68_08290 [Alphaproteobacteria bacterium]|nr:hypothetical protein [Alphaproteobacteria bacterium]